MKRLIAAVIILLSSANIASAEQCRQRFIDIVINSQERGYDGAITSFITQEINGATLSQNYYRYIDKENWLTEMVKPAGAPWSLASNNVLYISNDRGKTWQKIRELDSTPPINGVSDLQIERAKTVRGARCLKEEFEGQMLETLYAEYDMLSGVEGSIAEKMWLSPDSSWVPKSVQHIKMGGVESKTTQLITKTPDLVLPKPE